MIFNVQNIKEVNFRFETLGLFWTFVFTAVLIYLSTNLVMTVDNLDGWLRALYFAVLIPGYSLVIFQVRMYFKNKYEPEPVQ